MGRNGAGKTTTMRIALGVLAPDGGEVRWDGVTLDFAARRHIGYVPEERGLYPGMSTTVASVAGLTWLAGRVYANAALRLGTPVSFWDALRG